MDWQQRFESALDYIELNLGGDISIDEAARRANCSSFHFKRIFGIVCNVTLGEYIRRRRLSLAAKQLSSSADVGGDNQQSVKIGEFWSSIMADGRFGVLAARASSPTGCQVPGGTMRERRRSSSIRKEVRQAVITGVSTGFRW